MYLAEAVRLESMGDLAVEDQPVRGEGRGMEFRRVTDSRAWGSDDAQRWRGSRDQRSEITP